MPRITAKIEEALRPYQFHGLDVSGEPNSHGDLVTDCPFCGREDKLSLSVGTGQWRCFVCAAGTDRGGGNALIFLRLLHELGFRNTPAAEYRKLAEARRLLYAETLMEWGWCLSPLTRRWMVPGYGPDGTIRTLYVWGDKLYPTPTLGSWVFGTGEFRGDGPVLVCEGPWDGMALYEALGHAVAGDRPGVGYLPTSDRSRALGANRAILGVPGCGSVGEPVKRWSSLVQGRDVELYFDNDLPQDQGNGRVAPSAGLGAMRRAAELLRPLASSVRYLRWGDGEGYYDPELPHGYDLRDLLSGEKGTEVQPLAYRVERLDWIEQRLVEVPAPTRRNGKPGKQDRAVVQTGHCLACSSWRELVNAWRKALRWTDGLDSALACMLSSVLSTQQIGEQLWFEIIGPPSCGKTTVMEGISMNKLYVISKDTIRGFYSGWRDGDGEDSSLIAEAAGMTLAMKEGDAFIKAPAVQQILSEGRGIYDRVGRNHYRNATANEYEGTRMTWIICGTSAIREEIDSSELGARFLACVVMDGIDDEFEDDVLWRAVNQESRSMVVESDGDVTHQHPPELSYAMQLTGGYVTHLRQNATSLISEIRLSDEVLRWCGRLGKFVAYMRARPTKKDEHQEREFAARLAKQLVRLAIAKAAVTQREGSDPEIIRRVKKVALDTSKGLTLQIVELLRGTAGMDPGAIVLRTNQKQERVNALLRFLRQIGVLEMKSIDVEVKGTDGTVKKRGVKKVYVLTEKLEKLYAEVHQEE